MELTWLLIESKKEYRTALRRYHELMKAEPGTPEFREKELLQDLLEHFLKSTPPSVNLDPIQLIKLHMEQYGYTATDLAEEYGDKGTISKVLHYKQALSTTMIRMFSTLLHIPVEGLIAEYDLRK